MYITMICFASVFIFTLGIIHLCFNFTTIIRKINRWVVKHFVEINDEELEKKQRLEFKKQIEELKKSKKGEFDYMKIKIKEMIDQNSIEQFKKSLSIMEGSEFHDTLFYAISKNKVDIVKAMYEHNGLIYTMHNSEGRFPLMEALFRDSQETADFLAEITKHYMIFHDAEGNTDLHYAVSHNNKSVVEKILKVDSSKRFLDERNNDGFTAYEVARAVRSKAFENKDEEKESLASQILTLLVQKNTCQLSKEDVEKKNEKSTSIMQKIINTCAISGVVSNSVSVTAEVVSNNPSIVAASPALATPVVPIAISGGAAALASASYMAYKKYNERIYNKEHNIQQSSCPIL